MKRERKKRPDGGDIGLLTEFDPSSTMDYLHGDVADGEHEAACAYEYSREVPVLREATRRGREIASENNLPVIKVIASLDEEIEQRFSCGGLILQSPWLEFIICPNFPRTPWNQLSAGDREGILIAFPLQRRLMLDVRRLDGVCDALKALAVEARSEREQAGRRRIPPMLHKGQWTHALITIDWSQTEAQLVQDFRSLLRENTERLKEYRDTPMGKTGTAKDALKALASWRLLEHFKDNWVKADRFAEKHRTKAPAGEARAFHDHRKGKDGLKPNEAPLYGRKSGYQRAREKAQTHLRQMPAALFKIADDAEVLRDRLKRASEQLSGDYGVKEIFDVLEHSMPDSHTQEDSGSKPPVSEPDLDRTETLRQGEPERPERE